MVDLIRKIANANQGGEIERYDSGSFTPAITFGSGNSINTQTLRRATYEVINNKVRINLYWTISLSASGTGLQSFIIDLPSLSNGANADYPRTGTDQYNASGSIVSSFQDFHAGDSRGDSTDATKMEFFFSKRTGSTSSINYSMSVEYDLI